MKVFRRDLRKSGNILWKTIHPYNERCKRFHHGKESYHWFTKEGGKSCDANSREQKKKVTVTVSC
jgi:hypothetical protein